MATFGPVPPQKQFVLCFDGTKNKFAGDESDSNVLKIFRMLDRSKGHQFHYYQPGIGTYVASSNSLSNHGSRFHRIKSAYLKAKDSAIGSSFAEHVLGGYKFLMRYYAPGDDIYFIGFSRGAYVARFLAEMLDYVGLLEAGNEELIRFAWKTFAKWQQRRGETDEDRRKKKELFRFMKAFRETFSRPITRIKFLGLFDTVNSVPAFESAWMQRSKFPYTARSSAQVIRHAVGIDERRAKFRQDLISEQTPWHAKDHRNHFHFHDQLHAHHIHGHLSHVHDNSHEDGVGNSQNQEKTDELPTIVLNDNGDNNIEEKRPQFPPRCAICDQLNVQSTYHTPRTSHAGSTTREHEEHRYRAPSPHGKLSLAVPMLTASTEDISSIRSGQSGQLSLLVPSIDACDASCEEDGDTAQDIQEVWFPGGHADIGGGWKLRETERWALSHAPLVWMVQEAQRAGLQFDARKLKQFECSEEYSGEVSPIRASGGRAGSAADQDHVTTTQCQEGHAYDGQVTFRVPAPAPADSACTGKGQRQQQDSSSSFHDALHLSSTRGCLHDCLEFGGGLPALSVLSWKIMEYLPFRRMDLQPDGSWKPIRWPLPCGEVRDIPYDAKIHVSAIRRLKADPDYRPGNLIIGGGGRGVRRASEEYGIGEWAVSDYENDPVRETYVRKRLSKKWQEKHP